MSIGEQLAGLLLQALPTVVLIFLLYLFLKANFFKPLERVLEERSAKIEGARKASEGGLAAAVEKEKAYQEALRQARAQVYAGQEQARRAEMEKKSGRVRDARAAASERIRAAKDKIAAEVAAAKKGVERDSESLAAEIAKLVLERRPPSGPAMRGAQ